MNRFIVRILEAQPYTGWLLSISPTLEDHVVQRCSNGKSDRDEVKWKM